jgi:hypothetical protein
LKSLSVELPDNLLAVSLHVIAGGTSKLLRVRTLWHFAGPGVDFSSLKKSINYNGAVGFPTLSLINEQALAMIFHLDLKGSFSFPSPSQSLNLHLQASQFLQVSLFSFLNLYLHLGLIMHQ